MSDPDENPLLDPDPLAWDRCIESVGPASILVIIKHELRGELASRTTPEDIWQETLLRAWRSRTKFEWRGLGAWRRWLLQIARNVIRDTLDHSGAAKRGAGKLPLSLDPLLRSDTRSQFAGPVATTTPSRVASDRERAQAMERALESLPEDVREVVRLRLFEDLRISEIAERLALGESAVRHRFRRGAALYRSHFDAAWSLHDKGPELKTQSLDASSEIFRS